MIRKWIGLLLVTLFMGGVMMAMDNPITPVKVDQYRLANGLTVFLLEDHTLPLVAVNINYMVGSKNEKAGRTGFAHLFEHMMFQGSKHYNDDYFKPLQDIGGSVNGGTNTDRTRYWEVVPAGYLGRALWLESDRMGFLLDAMTQERLDNQISVVQNERRQNYENRPYGTVNEKMMAVLYPPNHPYSWTTIGSMADLQAATLDDVKEFFKTYYTPNNASLCVAGDFKPEEVKELIEKYFGAIPPGPPVSRLESWVPALSGEVVLNIQDRVRLPRTYIAWATVPMYSADDAALDVFARVLGGGKTSRLYQKLVYEQQIAQDAIAYHQSSQISGLLQMILSPRPGHTQEEVEQAALEVLRDTLKEGLSAEELTRIQTDITADFVRSMQSIGGFSGLSDRINEYYHYLGEPDMFRWDLQRYLDLTPEKVTAVARQYLGDKRVVARVHPLAPLSASTSETATSVDRAAMPGQGPQSSFNLPDRDTFTLPNGLKVVLMEQHKVPLLAFNLVIRGGVAADPTEREGLASLTADLLLEGAGGRTSKELAEAIEGLGASINAYADTDATMVSLATLKNQLDPALDLYADVITRPDFPANELERLRKRRLIQLMQLKDQPRYLAQVAFQKVLFGDHPYGHIALGDTDSLKAITLDEVKGFWQKSFVPGNAVLLVAGDITRSELEKALTAKLGQWATQASPDFQVPAPPQHGKRTIYIVDKPGAAQSLIMAGLIGPRRDTADYAALEVMNNALGGQFVSRLNLNLREDKGFTYGARSRFEFGQAPGAFYATAPVQTKVTAAAVRETVYELEGIAGQRPLTDQELTYAKGSLVNGYARRFETVDQLVRELLDTYLYHLPAENVETFPAAVSSITAADVARVGRKYILPDHLAIVIVGDRAAISDDLRQLDLGPIVVLDTEGNPIAK